MTPPPASVNCSCAHDGLSTMLQPSLKPQRYHPVQVAAASHTVGLGMEGARGEGRRGSFKCRIVCLSCSFKCRIVCAPCSKRGQTVGRKGGGGGLREGGA